MKKLMYLIVLTLILGLVLTGCFLSNVGQVPTSEQSGVTYLTKGPGSFFGLWHFDEGIGTTADDSSGNGNIGTLELGTLGNTDPASAWVGDQWGGQALSFDGIDDRVDCGNDTTLQMVDNLTVEVWVYWTGETGPYDTILARGGHTIGGFSVTIRNSTDEIWIFRNGGSVFFNTNLTLTKNEWNHIAVVKYANDDLKVYLNSGTPSTTTSFDISAPATDLSVRIGFWDNYWSGGHRFNGTIDEVRIWDEALTDEQIGDISPPEVTINAPADGGFYPIGAVPLSNYTVVDANSFTVEETGYSTYEGMHTYTVTATDVLGYIGWDSVTYYVLENFVTGGGKINKTTLELPGKGAALTFAGTIGVLEDEGIVGQFQIVDHIGLFYDGKGAESWHCNNFTFLEFSGEPAESPEASHDTAIFEGEFNSNRGGTEMVRLRIIDNGEPGAGNDKFSIYFTGGWVEWTIDGGNFQVHDIED